ncbi:MAG: type II secretion system minor pseudopilin GspJ [Rhodospirillaceae bacterium]
MHTRLLSAHASSGRGFTLIELLVAIFLLAVLSVMSYRGFEAMARANDHLEKVTDRWQAIALFFERIGTDISQATDRAVRDEAGAKLPQLWGRPLLAPVSTATELEFTRKSAPGENDLRLGYRLRERTLELLVWPVLDRTPVSQPQVHPLLENVSGWRLSYLDSRGRWTDRWPEGTASEALPRAVSIELALAGEPPVQRVFALP